LLEVLHERLTRCCGEEFSDSSLKPIDHVARDEVHDLGELLIEMSHSDGIRGFPSPLRSPVIGHVAQEPLQKVDALVRLLHFANRSCQRLTKHGQGIS